MEKLDHYNKAIKNKRYIDAAIFAAEIASGRADTWNRTVWVWEVAVCLQAAGIDFIDFVQPLRVADIARDFRPLFDQLFRLKDSMKEKQTEK